MARYAFGTTALTIILAMAFGGPPLAARGASASAVTIARVEIRSAASLRGAAGVTAADTEQALHVTARTRACPAEDRLPADCRMIVRDLD